MRELTGDDEAFLVEASRFLLPAQWTTEVLLCGLLGLAGQAPVTRQAVRSLTVGDRDALLLQVRRLSAGDRLECILNCPSPECGQKLNLTLNVQDLLVSPYAEAREWYETELRDQENTHRIRFRLPTGSDHEAAALVARIHLPKAAELLLTRCVESSAPASGMSVHELPAALQEQVAAKIAEFDAQAELALHVNCPACSCTAVALFDIANFLFQEMESTLRHTDHEVHLLAYHYHWSASEILGMNARRRRHYLHVLHHELANGASM